MKTFQEKLECLAKLLEEQTIEYLKKRYPKQATDDKLAFVKTKIVPGRKYTKIDMSGFGRYMVVNETGEIFGIKAYGVIHRGHFYGTLDTVDQYYWGSNTAYKKSNRKMHKIFELRKHDGTLVFEGSKFDCHMKAIELNGGHLNRCWSLKYKIICKKEQNEQPKRPTD